MELLLNASPLVNFGQMVKDLRARKMTPFNERVTDLSIKQKQIQVIMESKKAGITKDQRLKTLECVFSDEEYCSKIIEILSEMMPLWEFGIEESWSEEGDFLLMIAPQGFSSQGYDEVYEMLSDIENTTPEYSLTAFLFLLNYDMADYEIWQSCIEYFGWPFTEPMGLGPGQTFDRVFLKRYLKKQGFPELFLAAELAFFPKYNVFFEANNEDVDSVCFPFTAQQIRYLEGQWKAAKVILDKYEEAVELVAKSPEVLALFFEGLRLSYGRCDAERANNRVEVRVHG